MSGTFSHLSLKIVVLAAAVAAAPIAIAQRGTVGQPPAAKRTPSASPKVERVVPFRVGEQLSYDISWSSFLTAATATIAVREKKPSYGSVAYYITAEGRPTALVAAIYPLYYKVDTLLDVFDMLPQRASVFSQERGKREMKVTWFDQPRAKARFEVQAATTTTHEITLPPQTADPLGVIFALRAAPLKTGARTAMPVTFDGTLYHVQVTVDGREVVASALGTVAAWRLTPVLLSGGRKVASPRDIRLWISDDARRLPLKMQVELPVGRFNLVLRDAKAGR